MTIRKTDGNGDGHRGHVVSVAGAAAGLRRRFGRQRRERQLAAGTPATRELAADFPIIVSQGPGHPGRGAGLRWRRVVGEKPVIMNFWAAECPPCRAELPEFQKFYGEYRDRVLVLGIDLGQFTGQGTPEQGRELLAELGVGFPGRPHRGLRCTAQVPGSRSAHYGLHQRRRLHPHQVDWRAERGRP